MQAQLPVSLGGIGLKGAEDHATAAFAASLLSSQELKEKLLNLPEDDCPTHLSAALLAQLSIKQGEEATKENLTGVPQRAISLKISLHNHQLLTEHTTSTGVQRDIARLASLTVPHSGDWLNVLPSPNLGLHLRTAEWIISVKYRLGLPVFSTAGACPACHSFSDKEGDHAISCGQEGERIARHNHLRDTLPHCSQCCPGANQRGQSPYPWDRNKASRRPHPKLVCRQGCCHGCYCCQPPTSKND